jgi:hypothetical protein
MADEKQAAARASDEVTLIVAGASAASRDRAGGELQTGAFGGIFSRKSERTLEDMKNDIAKLSDQVSAIAAALQEKQGGKFSVASIEIGLAISAEGSIGIATAGVEASISLTLERNE